MYVSMGGCEIDVFFFWVLCMDQKWGVLELCSDDIEIECRFLILISFIFRLLSFD